jgi:prevent-host-death family protein
MTVVPPGSKTFSSRAFNQRASEAKNASKSGPVFITDRGEPAHVLLSIEDYRMLLARQKSIVELLAQPDGGDIELEVLPRSKSVHRPIDIE